MPPFQGASGGPSGGPLMTLLGEEVDIFFHPTGVRPGSILEVGDVAAFAGQVAPTLPSEVSIVVTTPSNEIKTIDASSDSSNYTSKNIAELIGEPAVVNDSYRSDCVIHTYRWPSGLLVKNHEIHIVFTKLSPLLSKKLAESGDERATDLYYYSAVAGQSLDPEANFPIKQKTIVQNLNPPPVSMGGG